MNQMRKTVVAAWLAVSSLVASVPASADSPVSLPPLAANEMLLEISAVGVARTPATSATLRASVQAQGATEAEARRAAQSAVQRITAAARAAGVAAADIDAGSISAASDPYAAMMNAVEISTVTNMAGDMGPEELGNTGAGEEVFYGTGTVTIRLRSAAAAPALQRALSDIDDVTAGTPDYRLDDESAARRTARTEAMRHARADAEAYAASMNMRIARVLRITERTGLDLAALAIGESSLVTREMRAFEQGQRNGQVSTYAIVGVDYALAPR
jgi:uncharacterized protein YggE